MKFADRLLVAGVMVIGVLMAAVQVVHADIFRGIDLFWFLRR